LPCCDKAGNWDGSNWFQQHLIFPKVLFVIKYRIFDPFRLFKGIFTCGILLDGPVIVDILLFHNVTVKPAGEKDIVVA
jgi:hypothetical protein